jgi:hypothetical protein
MILKVNIRNCSTLAIAGMILNVPLLAAEGSLFFADHPDGSDRYELYNLAIDPGELHDKTSAETERFSQLREILEKRLQETEAIIPQRNPAYRRK